MFMDQKIQYCNDVDLPQIDLYIQHNLNQYPSRIFWRNWGADCKICMDLQRTKNSQNNFKYWEQNKTVKK